MSARNVSTSAIWAPWFFPLLPLLPPPSPLFSPPPSRGVADGGGERGFIAVEEADWSTGSLFSMRKASKNALSFSGMKDLMSEKARCVWVCVHVCMNNIFSDDSLACTVCVYIVVRFLCFEGIIRVLRV